MSFASPLRPKPPAREQGARDGGTRRAFFWAIGFTGVVLLLGASLLHYGLREFFNPESDYSKMAFIAGLFVMLASLFALYALAIHGSAPLASHPLQSKFPGQPWLWRGDWAEGVIVDGRQESLRTAASMLLIAAALVLFLGTQARSQLRYFLENYPVLTWGVAAIGIFFTALMVAEVIYRLRQRRKFGSSTLFLDTVPCAVGTTFTGRIQTALRDIPPDGVKLSLDCVITTNSRGGNSIETRNVWHDERTLHREHILSDAGGYVIPVEFSIPRNAASSGKVSSTSECTWKIAVKASLPGVDYESEFELPVFRVSRHPAKDAESVRGESGFTATP